MMSFYQRSAGLAALMAGLSLSGTAALAQASPDLSGTPVYGSVKLASGFTPDPHEVTILPGGTIDVSHLAASCVGYVGREPDYQVEYDAGSLSLSFRVDGPIDTSLVVNGPNGSWMCDDDSGGNLDPLVTVLEPRSGRYDIWVGTLTSGVADEGENVRLLVTELDDVNRTGTAPDLGGTPVFGSVNLNQGFTPDPHRVEIVSGGSIEASGVSDGCMGKIGQAPDYQVNYRAGASRLTFKALGKGDSTLVINAPNGNWVCDDDSGGNQNPRLTFKAPQSGRYDIWVGDFREDMSVGNGNVILEVTEVD